MATTAFGSTAATVVIAVVLVAGAARLQAVREARYPPPSTAQETLYLQSGTTARRLAGAYGALMADAYWVRTLQYYGVRKLRLAKELAEHAPPTPESYDLLFPMLDLTTTLDPRFNIAYRFGSVFLSETYPSGPGRSDLAIALLEKGLRTQPARWAYMQDIGFVHYWYDHDYRAAADAFRKASEMPGAPWWLASLAATTLATGGDRQSSWRMWESIRQSGETEWLRKDAERRLTQLRALNEIDDLQQVVNEYRRQGGQPPANWSVLVRARTLRGVPLDPSGTPYELTPDGQVTLSRGSQLSPLPTEPVPQMGLPR